jgi:transposase-like protein
MNELFSAERFSKSEIAQSMLKVVEFSKKDDVKAACDAFGVSRATIFRWRRC